MTMFNNSGRVGSNQQQATTAPLKVIMPSNNKPIAPKKAASSSSSGEGASKAATDVTLVTSSTTHSRRKKVPAGTAFHPTLGYAIPPPQPAKVARRNARERNRVKQVNCGFEVLKSHIPSAAKHKKMSKVGTR